MKLKKESLIYNLWDVHQIIKGTDLRKQFLRAGDEEKKEIIHYYYLNRCLHWRTNQDPGFFSYVTARVSKDPEIIEKAIEYVKKIFGESTSTFEDYFSHKKIIERARSEKSHLHNQGQNSRDGWTIPNPENLQTLLRNSYYAAIERGDNDEAIAIRDQTVKSRSTQIFCGGDLFLEEDYNQDLAKSFAPVGGCKWDNEGRFFLVSKLKNFDLYHSSGFNDFDTDFLRLVEYPVVKRFCDKFEIYPLRPSPSVLSPELPESLIFGRDCLRIASEFLFDNLYESEKILLLNSEHPISLDIPDIYISPYFSNNVSVLRSFSDMKGMHSAAIQLYNLAFSQSKSNKEKSEICQSIANCYKALGKFSDAYGLYEHSFYFEKDYLEELLNSPENPDRCRKHLKDIEKDSVRSDIIRRLKDMAEMQYLLGNLTTSENLIDETVPFLESLYSDRSIPENIITIAQGYHSYGTDKKAIEILEQGLQKLPESLKNTVKYELTHLTNLTGIYAKSFEEEEKGELSEYNLSQLFRWAKAGRESFQYSLANSYLNKIALTSTNFSTLLEVGKEFFNLGDYQAAVEHLEPIIRGSSVVECKREAFLYSGISRVLSGDIENGLLELHQSIDLIADEMSRSNEDKNFQFQKSSIPWLFTRILERGLIHGESNVVAIIDDLKEYSLEKISVKPEELIDMIAFSYQIVGWDDKAVQEEQSALNKIEYASENYILFVYFIGLQYNKKGDLEKSLVWLERAVNHPLGERNSQLKTQVIIQMATICFQLSRFNEARDLLQKAYDLDAHTTDLFFPEGKKQLDEYLSDQISFESIQDSKVKSIFKTAEHLFRSQYADITLDCNRKNLDLSIILFNYGKGLEALLDTEVWTDLREYLFSKFSDDGTEIDDDELFSNIPFYFKMALSRNPEKRETVSLGTWAKINLAKKEEHPVVREINRYLKRRFSKNFETIRKSCELIAPYRNLSGHKEVITSPDEMIKRRKVIIPAINSVIQEVSREKN